MQGRLSKFSRIMVAKKPKNRINFKQQRSKFPRREENPKNEKKKKKKKKRNVLSVHGSGISRG